MSEDYRFSSKHLEAIRLRHESTLHPAIPTCRECQQAWSCDTDDALARIADLERQLAEAREHVARLEAAVEALDEEHDEAAAREVGYREKLEGMHHPGHNETPYEDCDVCAALAPAQGKGKE